MNRENVTDTDLLYRELMEQLAPADREYGEIVGRVRGRRLAVAASVAVCLAGLALWGWRQMEAPDVCLVRRDGQEVVSPQACTLMEQQMAEMFNP